MVKFCVACHDKFVLPRTHDEPEQFRDFCIDCLVKASPPWPSGQAKRDLSEAPDESPRLHDNCETCVQLQRREMDRERLGSAAAWAFMWWCIGLASSVWANEWLGLVDCLK